MLHRKEKHMNALQVGDSIPVFSAKNEEGVFMTIDPASLEGPKVIYFYPKDDTPGCTKEACSFRDSFESFTDLNVQVIGISADSVASHKNFKAKHRLPFTLLSDEENTIRKLFGVKTNLFGLIPGRVTYVVNQQGVIQHMFSSQLNMDKHVSEALESLTSN